MNWKDLVKEMKIPGLTREIMYFISGFFLLLIINFLFKPNLLSFPNLAYLQNFGIAVALSTASYFLARGCREIGFLVVIFLIFLCNENKFSKYREYVTDLNDYINGKSVTIDDSRNVNHSELHAFIHNEQGINFSFERNVQHLIFIEIFLGFSIILAIFYSCWLLIASIILGIYAIIVQFELWGTQVDVAGYLHSRKKNATEKS